MRPVRGAALLSLLSIVCALAGCSDDAGVCDPLAGSHPIADRAVLFRVEAYAESVACDGAGLQAGAAPPVFSMTFRRGEPIRLRLPSGRRAVVLTAFADEMGAVVIGVACQEIDGAASDACVHLTLEAPPDAAVTGCISDAGDACPAGRYCDATDHCVPGCKSDDDCAAIDAGINPSDGGAPPARPFCDPARHTCVGCRGDVDCPLGERCSDGTCALGCDTTLGRGCPGSLACCDGRCVDVSSSPAYCGGCGHACTGAQTLCCGGVCADPTSDPLHCGGCGVACCSINGAPACDRGACGWSCAPGFAHCDFGNTGCATPTDTIANCGACGNACDATHADDARCDGTTCAYTCSPGWGDCRTAPPDTDGCETDLSTTVASCGGCGIACDLVNSVGAACTAGACTYGGCHPLWADCNAAAPDVDGCETSLLSPTSCGGCGVVCDQATAVAVSCDGARCIYTCSPGHGDCVRIGANLDGCETPTDTLTDCGGCGNACDTATAQGATCDGTTCHYTACAPGRIDCNTAAPDTDGCECATPACCGAACQTEHDNGMGAHFYDCAPLGTWSQTQAMEACTAYTGSATACQPQNCTGGNRTVCSVGAATCVCWLYNGSNAGHVGSPTGGTCTCPASPTGMWN